MAASRAILAVYAAVQLLGGMWQYFLPRSFYDDFPVPGANWIPPLGPFNEHLMQDVGAAVIALALLGLYAAWRASREWMAATAAAFLLMASLHLAYHLGGFHHFTPESAIVQATALTGAVLVPLGLLIVLLRARALT